MSELKHSEWLIHKAGRGWYRPNAQGYTNDPSQAGRYSHKEALSYSHPNGHDGPRDGMMIKHESEVPGAFATPTRATDLPTVLAYESGQESMRAEIERLREVVKGPLSWLENWATHVGSCRGDSHCTCGLTLAQHELRQALGDKQ